MARNKSFLKKISIDTVIKSHNCAHDSSHRLNPGDKRLKLKQNRNHNHYCIICALKFIEIDISKLTKIKNGLSGNLKILL